MRARSLATLQPGDFFEMRDSIAGTVTGQVIRMPESRGYVQVRVYRDAEVRAVLAGATELLAPRIVVLEWSARTLVYKVSPAAERGDRMTEQEFEEDTGDKIRKREVPRELVGGSGLDDETPLPKLKPGEKAGKLEATKMAKIDKLKAAEARAKAEGVKPAGAKKEHAAPKPPSNDCHCGCGEKVRNRFRQGHDGRYYGWLQKVVDGRMKFEELALAVRKRLNTPAGAKKELDEHNKLKAKNKAERG